MSMAESTVTANVENEDLHYLPEPPEEPLQTDCCGTGCTPCVFDIYQEQLEEWLQLKAMTPEERRQWRKTRMGDREKEAEGSAGAALSPSEYRTFTIERIRQLTADSFVFTFKLPPEQVSGLQVGQHAILRVCEPDGHILSRQYTPVSPLDHRGSFDVVVKVYENGRMSHYIKQWQVGSMAAWRGPFGNFAYTQNKYARIGMLACGTGIAPMIQIIKTIVENDKEDAFIHLVYGCRTQQDILLKDELDHYASYWNFTVLYALSRCTESFLRGRPGMIKYGDKVHFGRIGCDLVCKEMPPPRIGNLVLICGTKSFDKDMINYLSKAGYTKDLYLTF